MSDLIPTKINSDTDFLAGALLLINKPYKWTSFDVVKKIRNLILKKKNLTSLKVGHAGTLDPLATGLLIVCTGKLTKEIQRIQKKEKEYTGEIILGGTTKSFDLETKVSHIFPTDHITKDLLYSVKNEFIGSFLQRPPAFSALKKNGKRLYNIARKGDKILIKERPVIVNSFEITNINMPKICFKICCEKGTYIRSIANDYGKALNSGGYLSKLCRTKIGGYTLRKALNIEAVSKKMNLL